MRCGLLALFTWIAAVMTAEARLDFGECRQAIVVLAGEWKSTRGALRAFERERGSWRQVGGEVPVVLGKSGLAEGIGLLDRHLPGAPRKREGDNCVPAGIFRLTAAFGYAPAEAAKWIRLPYIPLNADTEGVDDPKSRYYNRIVHRSEIAQPDWRSSEKMRRDDVLYKWGIFVDHNPQRIAGAGSCIFLHVWRNSASPTVGCTAMPEADLVRLLRWLDPRCDPILVQVPAADYEQVAARYRLPQIEKQ